MKTNATNQIKCFRDMTPSEQAIWMTSFNDFRETKWPAILSHAYPFGTNIERMIEEGLHLFAAYPQYRNFVEDSLRFRDYHRRMRQFSRILNDVRTELTANAFIVKTTTKNRPGRPTREEVAERERQERLAKAKAAQQEQIDRMNGVIPTKPTIAYTKSQNLFDLAKHTQAHLDPSGTDGEIGQHLDNVRTFSVREIEWLLSPALRLECDLLSVLRRTADEEANKAKELAVKGTTAEIIESHTKASFEAQERYDAILCAIDNELLSIYNRESANPSNDFRNTIEQHGYQLNSFMQRLAFHADKARSENEDKELQNRKRNIRDYFKRKDIKLTPERIRTMKERIEEARMFGMDVEKFESLTAESERQLMAQNEAESVYASPINEPKA